MARAEWIDTGILAESSLPEFFVSEIFTYGAVIVPKILIDRDELVREIDDLVKVNNDAGAKTDQLALAIAEKDIVAADGEKLLIETTDKVDSNNAAALEKVVAAEVASKVANELLTRQIDHLKKRIEGIPDDDPTPNPQQLELDI